MTLKGRMLQRLAPVLDVIMLPFVWLAAQQMMLVRRITPRHMPRAMAMLDRIGIYPLIDHYYEPLINLRRLRHSLDQCRVLPGIALDAERGLALLGQMAEMAELANTPRHAAGPTDYYLDNDFFGPLDAAVLYALVRRHRPRRIVEVGCGMSTRVVIAARLRNVAEDAAYACEHVCIEPYEQPWLADAPVTLSRGTAETSDPALIDALDDGDILFIDSSHMIRPQGDVLTEILNWLGRLRPGVLVHVHDIFTPKATGTGSVRYARRNSATTRSSPAPSGSGDLDE
jgi:predicted O-methyltransferase YrrM